MIPPILTEICQFMSTQHVAQSSSGDGRIDSAVDESAIRETINQKFPILSPSKNRCWWDFAIEDEGVFYPVNIKLSEIAGANDNMNCKLGIYYALTGQLPNFANETNWYKFFASLSANIQSNEKDYYFMIFNKHDSTDVFVQGLKTISTLVPNGNNLPFQCCWRDNREPCERTFEQARDFLLTKFAQSVKLRSRIYMNFLAYFPQYLNE